MAARNYLAIVVVVFLAVGIGFADPTDGPWHDVSAYDDLATAIDAHKDANATLLIWKPIEIGAPTLDIPSNIVLQFLRGGSLLQVPTVNIKGSIEAGPWHIFHMDALGKGKVTFGGEAAREVYPQWWGAKVNDETDDTTPIQNAIDSGSRRVFFPSGTYIVGTLTVDHSISLIGSHIRDTILKLRNDTNDTLLKCEASPEHPSKRWTGHIYIADLTLDGNSYKAYHTDSNGISVYQAFSCSLDRVRVMNFSDYAVYLDTCNDITFSRCYFCTSKYGFYATKSGQCNLMNCVVEANSHYGARYDSPLAGAVSTIQGCWFETGAGISTKPDYIVVNSGCLNIVGNKFNMGKGYVRASVRVLKHARHNLIMNNAAHEQSDTNEHVVFEPGAKDNISIGNRGGTKDKDGGNWVLEFDALTASAFHQKGRTIHNIGALEKNSQTPSVLNGNYFVTRLIEYHSERPITDFIDGENGQVITIIARHHVTIENNDEKIVLNHNRNFIMVPTDTLTLIMDNGVWKEISRSESRPINNIVTLEDSTTPSVLKGNYFQTKHTVPITNFVDGANGQTITIIAVGPVTVVNSDEYINLKGDANFVMGPTDTLTLIRHSGKWKEISRSDN
jgi:hypothetical protein